MLVIYPTFVYMTLRSFLGNIHSCGTNSSLKFSLRFLTLKWILTQSKITLSVKDETTRMKMQWQSTRSIRVSKFYKIIMRIRYLSLFSMIISSGLVAFSFRRAENTKKMADETVFLRFSRFMRRKMFELGVNEQNSFDELIIHYLKRKNHPKSGRY